MNGRQMAEVNCPNEDKYRSKDGRCCNRCKAGWYMRAECDDNRNTDCARCEHGLYTATKNHLSACQHCRDCSSQNNLKTVKYCTPQENAVCECMTGFYCSDDQCEHCKSVRVCPPGTGVKVQATRTNDTICAPCEDGTYSNVTDFHSPCKTHTRCEDYGRLLKTQGTSEADAICGNFKNQCPWILPAGLWSGLVLTALVLFVFMCWREKRKSYRPASPIIPVTFIETVPAPPGSPPHLPLPTTELSYCQESCTEDGCTLPLFKTDDNVVSDSTQDSVDSCPPITPLKVSISFTESSHMNGNASYATSNFLRTFSEPQEDEWCGT